MENWDDLANCDLSAFDKNDINSDLKLKIFSQALSFLYSLSNSLPKRATDIPISYFSTSFEEFGKKYIQNYSYFLKVLNQIIKKGVCVSQGNFSSVIWAQKSFLKMARQPKSENCRLEIDSTPLSDLQKFNKPILEIHLAKKLILDISSLNSYQSIQVSYLNQIHFDEHKEITKHLMKFSSKTLKKQLYKIVKLSKDFNDISLAASNAATILNKIGFSFSRRNLRGIRIPYADLTKGRFLGTDFSNSDLSYTDFTNAMIISANFNGSWIHSKSEVGKILDNEINDEWKIEKIIFSPCKKYMAFSVYKQNIYFQYYKCIKVFWSESEPKVLQLETCNINHKAAMSFSFDSNSVYIADASGNLIIWNYHENTRKDIIAYPQYKLRFELILTNQYMVYFYSNKISFKSLPSLELVFEIPFEARSINLIFTQNSEYFAWNTDTQTCIFSLKTFSIEKTLATSGNIIFLRKNLLVLYSKMMRRYEIWDIYKEEIIYQYKVSPRNSSGTELLISEDGRFLVFWIYNKVIFMEIERQLQTRIYLLNQVSISAINARVNTMLYDWGITGEINSLALRFLKNSQKNENFDLDNIKLLLIRSIHWSPCGKFIWFLYENAIVKEWDMKKKKWRQSLDFSKTKCQACTISGNLAGIIDEFFSKIEIWDIYSKSKIKTIYATYSEDNVEEFEISAISNRAYIVGKFSSLYIYDIESGEIIWYHRKISNNYLISTFFGDYYAYSRMNSVTFIDIKNDTTEPYNFDCDEISKIIPSIRNQWIALFALKPHDIFLLNWNDKSFKKLNCGEEQEAGCFSPSEKYFASSANSQILLWDINKECIISKTNKYFNSLGFIAYSPLGKYIALSISGDSIMIYNHKKCLKEYEKRKLDEQSCDLNLEIELNFASIVSE